MSKPSVAELRAVCQPTALVGRRSGEHWAGRLYMRRLSLRVTRLLVDAPVSPDGLTALMVVVGLAAAVTASLPGVGWAVVTAVAVQGYLLLDCVDGELARWRRSTSTRGVYLDRVGHYLVEAALVAAVGVRADGGPGVVGGWTTLSLLAAVFVLLNKSETDLVAVARASAGLGPASDADARPRSGGIRALRGLGYRLPVHRAIGAVELSLLLLVAATADAVSGGLGGSRALVGAVTVVAGLVAAGHLASILSSDRLRG